MTIPSAPRGAQAALRALRLLKLFTIERPEMTLSEISQAAGLNKTTAHRLLRALLSESLIEQHAGDSRYSLGPGLMALGVQALASSDLRRRVRPVLKTLAQSTGETATLEIPFENSMLILDEVAGKHVVAAAGNIGTRWPLHATSTGKVLLAFDEMRFDELHDPLQRFTKHTVARKDSFRPALSHIRQKGYAETVDELEEGFAAVAAVIRTAMGDVQGALSIGGPTQRLNAARRARFGVALRTAAAGLSGDAV